MKNLIIEELKNRGYDKTIEYVTNKNGVEMTGISIRKSDQMVGVVVYDNYEWKDMSIEEICDDLETIVWRNIPDFNPDEIHTNSYIRNNSRLVAFKDCSEKIFSRDFIKGIKIGIRVFIDRGSYLLPINLYSEDLFEIAKENTIKHAYVSSMRDVIAHMLKSQYDAELDAILNLVDDMFDVNSPEMYVVSNEDNFYGAGIIFIKSFFRNLCTTNKWIGCYIIPSSVHEIIIIPDKGDNNLNYIDINRMIKEVNAQEVSPEEQLGEEVLYYDLEKNEFN